MGLDVEVRQVFVPDETLDTLEKVEAFCKKNHCSFNTAENCPAIRNTPFLVTVPREYCNFDPIFKREGLSRDDYEVQCWCCGVFTFRHKTDRTEFEVDWAVDPDAVTKIMMVDGFFTGSEVGWQRKGANSQFYLDGKWDSDTVVVDRKTLLEHWDKYFSDEDDHYYGKDARQHFKENIIDVFEEGKHVVCYW